MVTSSAGVGASVLRKEDDDSSADAGNISLTSAWPGLKKSHLSAVRTRTRESWQSMCRLRSGTGSIRRNDLSDVKPIRAATALAGFKHSYEPILASGKVRYVGELIAMCRARTRAEAEDFVAMIEVEYEELPAVTDMAAALEAHAPLVHEQWGDNIFIEIRVDGDVDTIARTAPVKISREVSHVAPMHVSDGRARSRRLSRRAARLSHRDVVNTDAPHRAKWHRRLPWYCRRQHPRDRS